MRSRLAAVASCLAVLALAGPAHATFPGKNGKIALFNDQDIHVVDPDGSNLTNVTNFPGSDTNPAWSADGNRIAYASAGWPPGATGNIWYTSPDGTGTIQVTTKEGAHQAAGDPTWSPAGNRIVYTLAHGSPAFMWVTVNVVDVDGTNDHELCCGFENAGEATWSPDGEKIAFTRSPRPFDRPYSLWTMNADGSGKVRICCEALDVDQPDWSPDGRAILFHSGPSLYVVNADGTGLRSIYTRPPDGGLFGGAWSPDGERIVFAEAADRRVAGPALYTMRTDSSDRIQVSPTPSGLSGGFSRPSWQPIPAPRRGDYKNAAAFCKAERDFFGDDQFRQRYGGVANAYGKCVSSNN